MDFADWVDSGFGEVPKRLKGLPWKGSRALITSHGFKSHLLRCIWTDLSALVRDRDYAKEYMVNLCRNTEIVRKVRIEWKIKISSKRTKKGVDKTIYRWYTDEVAWARELLGGRQGFERILQNLDNWIMKQPWNFFKISSFSEEDESLEIVTGTVDHRSTTQKQ